MDDVKARKLAQFRADLAVLEDQRTQVEAWQVSTAFTVSNGFSDMLDALDAIAKAADGIRVAMRAYAEHHANLVALALEVGQPAPDPVDDPLEFVERSLSDQPRLVALWRAVIDGRLAALLEAGDPA